MGTQTQGGGSDLPPSIQQKIDRIRELQSEIARLTEEAEREYFTAERLERFDEKYRRLSFNDALLLVAFLILNILSSSTVASDTARKTNSIRLHHKSAKFAFRPFHMMMLTARHQ